MVRQRIRSPHVLVATTRGRERSGCEDMVVPASPLSLFRAATPSSAQSFRYPCKARKTSARSYWARPSTTLASARFLSARCAARGCLPTNATVPSRRSARGVFRSPHSTRPRTLTRASRSNRASNISTFTSTARSSPAVDGRCATHRPRRFGRPSRRDSAPEIQAWSPGSRSKRPAGCHQVEVPAFVVASTGSRHGEQVPEACRAHTAALRRADSSRQASTLSARTSCNATTSGRRPTTASICRARAGP